MPVLKADIANPVVSSTQMEKVLNKIRRYFLCKLSSSYVKQQEKVRQGHCRQCGTCCKLVYRCPFLKEHDGSACCAVYNITRPRQCTAFPISQRDLKDVAFKCGYKFQDKTTLNS